MPGPWQGSAFESLLKFLGGQWNTSTPLWMLATAVLSVAGTSLVQRWERRRELRRVRGSLAILAFSEMQLILGDLGGERSVTAARILLLEVMIQRGGFEKLDAEVIGSLLRVFRCLEEIGSLEQRLAEIGRRGGSGSQDESDASKEMSGKRREAHRLILAFLDLLRRREGPFVPPRALRELTCELEKLNAMVKPLA